MKFFLLFFFILGPLGGPAQTAESKGQPKGKITSPYMACQKQIIIDEEKYLENKSYWDALGKKCQTRVILAPDIGLTSLDPLREGVKYLEFSQRVAQKVKANLIKSRKYADCSARCFNGEKSCEGPSLETVKCADRKNEVLEALKVYSRRIRIELAMSTDAPGLLNVDIHNVLALSKNQKEKLINKNLRDFEIGTPNPVGRTDLTERELREVNRRQDLELRKLEEEFRASGARNYEDWMSIKLMERFENHQALYRGLIYEEAPIFGVIDRPRSFDERNDPVWSDEQIAGAFKKLSANSRLTEEKVDWSIQNGKLEFDRLNAEALKKWAQSFDSKRKDTNDLLLYVGMKNAVEEVLENDPGSCGVATALEARLRSKELQNSGVTLAASLSTSLFGRFGGSAFGVLRSLGGAEIARVTGLAIGTTYLGDNFRKYNLKTTEAATKSGLSDKSEGVSLVRASEVAKARESLKSAMMFSTADTATIWRLGRKIYGTLSRQIQKDIPEAELLLKESGDAATKDLLTDKWLEQKLRSDVSSGLILKSEGELLKSEEGKRALNKVGEDLYKKNPDFFKDPKNVTLLFKSAAQSALAKNAPLRTSSHLGEIIETTVPYKFPSSMHLRKYKNEAGEEVLMYEKVITKDGKNMVLSREMTLDPLTGAYDANYPAGKQLLEDLIKESEGRATLAFIDVNNLGYVNKNFFKEREAGDAYLAAVAKAINKATEGKAQIFKLGGDEYGVLIHEADPKTAQAQLQKIIEECYSKEVHSIFKENTILRAQFVRKEFNLRGPGERFELDPGSIKIIKDYAPYSKEGISIGAASIKKGNTLEELLSAAESQATSQKILAKTELNISAKKYGGPDSVPGGRPNLRFRPTAEAPVSVVPAKINEVKEAPRSIAFTKTYGEDQLVKLQTKLKDVSIVEYKAADGSKVLKYERPINNNGRAQTVSRELVVNAKSGFIDGTHESGKFILSKLAEGPEAALKSRGMIWINAEHLGKINYFKSGTANGDKLLAQTAKIIKEELKGNGIPIKMQGSEFIIMLDGVSKEKLAETMQKINHALINDPEIKSIFSNQLKYLQEEYRRASSGPVSAKGLKKIDEITEGLEVLKTVRPEFSMESHVFKAQDDLKSALKETREQNYSRRP